MRTQTLDNARKREMKARAHALKAVVSTGNAGLSEGVFAEIELALDHHELLKIKLGGADKAERKAMADTICAKTGAAMVQLIGGMLSIYRQAPERPAKPRKKASRPGRRRNVPA